MLEILKINKFSVLELISSFSTSFTDTWKKKMSLKKPKPYLESLLYHVYETK